jgi:hypothetical protein
MNLVNTNIKERMTSQLKLDRTIYDIVYLDENGEPNYWGNHKNNMYPYIRSIVLFKLANQLYLKTRQIQIKSRSLYKK